MGDRLNRRQMLNTSMGAAAALGLVATGALTGARTAAAEPADAADSEALLTQFADAFSFTQRSPILHTPDEHGLDYEDVTFPARDGVPLEGWFIPARGSDKVIIANHPMGFSRSGLPSHLEPWRSLWAPSGNGFEVDLTPDLKILHDAGYNVLTYDLRNLGHSGAANGGVASSGIYEARDVVGSLDYVRARRDTRRMKIGLFSRCLGCSSTFAAMTQFPEAFAGVRCLVGPQPVTAKTILERRLAMIGLPDAIDRLEELIVLRTSIGFARRSPIDWAKNVNVPAFLYQVRGDVLTRPSDVQTMFDNIPVARKKLRWIEGTTARWDGYLEFQRRPEPMLAWFATHFA
ncbi:alpha/beta hydrolase family protein [Streptomyces sp. NPDC127033]|uniref:alpha/beta hydrolase family protein n=1 Tax=Streptomyces sp. NPDC127033 TaxID=3347110 RepID=UPI0036484F41